MVTVGAVVGRCLLGGDRGGAFCEAGRVHIPIWAVGRWRCAFTFVTRYSRTCGLCHSGGGRSPRGLRLRFL